MTKTNYNMTIPHKYDTIKVYTAVLNDYDAQADYTAEQLLNMQEAVYLLKEDVNTDIVNLFNDVEVLSDLEMEL